MLWQAPWLPVSKGFNSPKYPNIGCIHICMYMYINVHVFLESILAGARASSWMLLGDLGKS